MSGIIVGRESPSTLDNKAVSNELHGVCNEFEVRYEINDISMIGRSAEADPAALQVYTAGKQAVLVYGTFTSPRHRSEEDLVLDFFNKTGETLAELNGEFLLVGVSPRKLFFATDKLGARLPFYITNKPYVSSSVSALLPFVSDLSVDRQAVNDLLIMGHLWGDRTLVESVKAGRPASVYEYDGSGWSENRYWKPSLSKREGGEEYLREMAKRYQTAVYRTALTLPEKAGIWLSGGLDSRTTSVIMTTASASKRYRLSEFSGYTYDANPPTGDNPRLAERVASKLGMPQEHVKLDSSTFTGDRVERVIDVCDGTVAWNITQNLSPSYDIVGRTPVLMEGVEGSLLGDHLLKPHFKKASNAVESQIMSEVATTADLVSSLIEPRIDPYETLKEEVRRTNEQTLWKQILDIHFQNYYNRLACASNTIIRDVGGSRTTYVDGDFLEWVANLPLKYRKSTFPFTNSIPTGTSRAKLDLSRRINEGVDNITYERTKIPPKYPYPLHVAGFLGNVVFGRLRSKATYGSGQLADFWLRDSTDIAKWTEEYIGAAAGRDLFSDRVLDIWDDHQRGANNSSTIAQVTTVEYWLQEHIDHS